MEVNGKLGGWLREEEDWEYLRRIKQPSPASMLRAMRTQRGYGTPEKVDPRDWLQIENQRNMGSCQGHSLSTCVEVAYNYEADKIIQLSRMFAYVMSQRKDGIRGDRGSTISGGAKCAKEDGICLESTYPYPSSYTTNIPSAAITEAKEYRIKSAFDVKSYDDVFQFLASAVGAINIGISWTLPSAAVIESYRSGRGGGHAIALAGYTARKDNDGRNYIILVNSWGTQWGNNGTAEVAPRAIEQMINSTYSEFIALSDMEKIEPRRIKYKFL